MRKFLVLMFATFFMFLSCSDERSGNPKVLVFTKTAGFVHKSIPKGVEAIEQLGIENQFEVVVTDDSSYFTDENLQQYSAVIFLSTTGDVLDSHQEVAFERYIQSSGMTTYFPLRFNI